MSTIQNLFQQAQLAEAAYADLTSAIGKQTVLKQVLDVANKDQFGGSFSQSQATDFALHWRVVSQQPDTLSGFSATLFQCIDGPQIGQYYYAIKGTLGGTDLAADAGDIVMDGLALDQIVDMYNDWQRINTASGMSYQAAQLVTESALTTELQQSVLEWAAYNANPLVVALPSVLTPDQLIASWVNRTDIVVDKPSNTVRTIQFAASSAVFTDGRATGASVGASPILSGVTGHSLGGHLAAAFTRLFPGVTATTINGAGYPTGVTSGLGGFAETNIRNLFGMLQGASSFDPGAITNIHGDGLNFVSMNSQYGLVQQGGNQEIYIESMNLDTTLGHGAGQMTDSLAIYNLLATLDPGLNTAPDSLTKITNILKASSNVAANSLESTVSALGKLFNVSSTSFNANEFDGSRDLLYKAVQGIAAAIPAGGLTLVALDGMDATTLAANARTDIAYRYALKELNPFAVTGADYSRFNTNGSLDVRNPATGIGELSESWLQDRAAMLGALAQRNIADSATIGGDKLYRDVENQITLRPGSLFVNDYATQQIVFGSEASNPLNGGDNHDRLYGMGGNDSVNGGAGNDYLEGGRNDDKLNGGTGNDTYVYLKGDGKDTITDADGLNTIFIGATPLTGTSEKSILGPKNTREWTVNGGEYVYRLDPNLHTVNISGTALGSGDANSITLKDITDLAQLKSRYGIDLALSAQVALTESAINPFTSYAESVVASLDAIGDSIENGAKRINLAFNQLLSATDHITIVIDSIVGMGRDYMKLVTGDQVLGFDTGSITLNATEGQNFISLALLEQGDLSANASATFKAIIERTDANGVVTTINSNLFTLNISDSVAVNTLTGDNAWTLATTYGNGWTYKDQFGHLITDPAQLGTMASVVNGSFDNDIIYGDAAITTVQAIANGNSDTATGNKGDWLAGRSGKDVLIAGAGNDVLSGGGGDDLLIAGAGEDIILGDADYVAQQTDWSVIHEPNGYLLQPAYGTVDPADSGNDTIYAGAGNDHVWSGIGDDTVLGEGGDDSLNGDGGNDFIDGGDGNDSVQGGEGSDTLYGGAGNDIVSADDPGQVLAGSNYLNGENGNDTLYGGKGDDTMLGGADTDILWGNDGNDLMDGGDGADTLWGGNGNDTVKGGTGDDKLYGEAGANYLDGGDGADTLNSGGPDSALYGGAGNDDITAAGGGNRLDGGTGDDTLATSGNDNYLDGGEGTNSLQSTGNYNALFAGTGNDDLAAWGDGNYLDAGNGNNTLYVKGVSNELYAGTGNDNLQATGGNNTLDGGSGNNTLVADTGGNTLIAGAGNDSLSSTGGGSYLDGGDGTNTLIADGGNNILISGAGNDTLSSAGGASTLDGGDGADYLVADGGGNTLLGGAGDDTLVARGGNNTLDGGDGRDLYAFDAGFGVNHISDSGTGGNTLRFNFAFAGSGIMVGLGSLKLSFPSGDELHIDNYDPNDPSGTCAIDTFVFDDTTLSLQAILDLGGPAVDFTRGVDITGTEGADTLLGTDRAEHIYGLGGNDTIDAGARNDYIEGGAGNDTIDGGAGADTMKGGLSDDVYVVDNVGDVVSEIVNEGWDAVHSSIDYVLGNHVEELVLMGASADINGTGNALANYLIGNDGNNILLGNAGDDVLEGGAGNDTLSGDTGIDSLDGGAGNDTLSGGAGDDTLWGRAGADTMVGGAGNDYYQVDDSGDTVTENLNEGKDWVQSSLSYTLGANIENLSLSGTDNIDGIGNALNNSISGNAGNNNLQGGAGDDELLGGAGADTMSGGSGNDTYSVDDVGDVVIENVGTGTDTVYSSINFTLTDNVENLILSDLGFIGVGNSLNNSISVNNGYDISLYSFELYGDGGNDVLTGNYGKDRLDGGTGADSMSGSLGNDTYVVDNTGDRVFEMGYGDIDTILSSVNYSLGNLQENLTLTGTDNINGTGNELSNIIIGNSGNNTLTDPSWGNDIIDGGAGADIMSGGYYSDTYYVDNVGDQVVETYAGYLGGDDTVYSSVTFTLGNNVENLVLTGVANIDGLGSAQANVITGNSGINVLSGGAGDDVYYVQNSGDTVIEFAGGGNDQIISDVDFTLSGNTEHLTLNAGARIGIGDDSSNVIDGNPDDNVLEGRAGEDYLDGYAGNDSISGGDGNDTIYGGYDQYYWDPETGFDGLRPNSDRLDGGAGDDNIDGGSGNDTISGGDGNDALFGGDDGGGEGGAPMPNDDSIYGDAGDDSINGGTGADRLYGGTGNDSIYGGDDGWGGTYFDYEQQIFVVALSGDLLDGGDGDDTLDGASGNDLLIGGEGRDELYGGEGKDVLYGSAYGDVEANAPDISRSGEAAVVAAENDGSLLQAMIVPDNAAAYNLNGVIGDGPTVDAATGNGWDYDFYKFTNLSVGSVIDVATFSNFDTVIGLYDSNGNLIVDNNDADWGMGISGNSQDSRFTYTIWSSGDYYLAISDAGNWLPYDPFDPNAGADIYQYAYSGGMYAVSFNISMKGPTFPVSATPIWMRR